MTIQRQWQQWLQAEPTRPSDSAGAGVAWLPELAVVRFAGKHARTFLQGYLTCDTDEIAEGRLLPTALCNLQGRVVMNGWCTAEGDENVLLVLHASLVDGLARFLQRYLMFSRKTVLEDRRDAMMVLGGLDLPETAGGLAIDARRRLFLIRELTDAQRLWQAHPPLDGADWLDSLTADGVPLVSAPVSEAFLPQMLNLHVLGAVDFEKGCYLGQEVVARAQHRGQVKRHLARLVWEGEAPSPGAQLTDGEGKAQGVVLQSGGRGESGPALAVLRDEAPELLRQGDTLLRRPG
ncbi:MAG TPA: hypothetical protein VF210_08340 [Pseudomonadales bacterium]